MKKISSHIKRQITPSGVKLVHSLRPVHYKDRRGNWQDVCTDFEVDHRVGEFVAQRLPFSFQVNRLGIGFTYQSKSNGLISMELLSVGDEHIDATKFYVAERVGSTVTFKDVAKDTDIKFLVTENGVKTFRILKSGDAARIWMWKTSGDDAGLLKIKPEFFGVDASNRKLAGLEIDKKLVGLKKEDEYWIYTETWDGSVVIKDPETRQKNLSYDPQFPVEIDPDIVESIGVSADDGTLDETNFGSSYTIYCKNQSLHYRGWGIWRFQTVDVPNAQTISLAELVLTVQGNSYGGAMAEIRGVKVANLGAWNTVGGYNGISGSLTTASVSISTPLSVGDHTIDVTAIVQELVNQGGWSANNNLGFVAIPAGGGTTKFLDKWDGATTSLTISLPGLGEGELTFDAHVHDYDSVTLTWTGASTPNGTVTEQLQINDGGGWVDVTGETSSPGIATGLDPETEYDFRVSYTDDSETVYSNTVTVTTDAEPIPLAQPIELVAQGETTLTLCAWPAIRGEGTPTYQWYRSTTQGFTPGGGNILSGETSRTLVQTGLTPNTIYYYVLRVIVGDFSVDYTEFDVLTLGATVTTPVVDSVTMFAGNNNALAGTATWNHTCSGTNRVLYVTYSNTFNTDFPLTITYNGIDLTPIGRGSYSPNSPRLFRLHNPPLGTHAVVVKYFHVGGTYEPVGGSVSIKDACTINSEGLVTNITANSGAGTADVETGENELVLGVLSAVPSATEGPGVTKIGEQVGSLYAFNHIYLYTATQSPLTWTFTGSWAILAVSIKPVGSSGVPLLPSLKNYETLMLSGGTLQADAAIAAHADFLLNANPNSAACLAVWGENATYTYYYSGAKVLYDIGTYRGETVPWDEAAAAQAMVLDECYIGPTGGYIQPWRMFSDQYRLDYQKRAYSRSRDIVQLLRDVPPYAADASPTNDLDRPGYSRECAYHLLNNLNAELLGFTARTARHDQLVEWAKEHVAAWVDSYWLGTGDQMSPFMVGLTARSLIRQWTVTGDAEILPLLVSACDYLWDHAWHSGIGSMQYDFNPGSYSYDGVNGNLAGGSFVLSNLISPMYAWVASQTGDAAQMARAELMFACAASATGSATGKQFNQMYTWVLGSDAFLEYRQAYLESLATSVATPSIIPKNHPNYIYITLTGIGTDWVEGETIFTPSGVTGVAKISQIINSETSATIILTTDATHTGTLSITESVTGSTVATITVATASISVSPTSGLIGATPVLTITGTNTVWLSELPQDILSISGGATLTTPIVSSDTSLTVVVATGSGTGTLTITDNTTGAEDTFDIAVATSYTLTGPSSSPVNTTKTFTITPNGDATGIVFTPHTDGTGTFNVVSVTGSGTTPKTFTYTPTDYLDSPHVISITDSGSLSDQSLNYEVVFVEPDGITTVNPDNVIRAGTVTVNVSGKIFARSTRNAQADPDGETVIIFSGKLKGRFDDPKFYFNHE